MNRSRRLRWGLLPVLLAACGSVYAAGLTEETYAGRRLLVYVPAQLPVSGTRALVVVLHGGLGNAQRIESRQAESGLNLDAVAEQAGFVVAYLNGTPVTRFLGDSKLGWNAGGGCCGQSYRNGVDDVGYLKGAIASLAGEYGIDLGRVYGIGHSNGAMMTLRMECETGIYAAAVAISGPLTVDDPHCGAARGRRILAIHGADDQNVPIAGGVGRKGVSRVAFKSEESSRRSFESAGASYRLQVVPDADHFLNHIEAAIRKSEGLTIAQKAAAFFGLAARGS